MTDYLICTVPFFSFLICIKNSKKFKLDESLITSVTYNSVKVDSIKVLPFVPPSCTTIPL